MPRPANHAASISASVGELLKAVASLVGSVQSAVKSSASVREAAAGVGRSARGAGAAAAEKADRLRHALRAYWAGMKGAARVRQVRQSSAFFLLASHALRKTKL